MLSYIAAAYEFFAPTSHEAGEVRALVAEILGEGYDAENAPAPAEKKETVAGLDAAALMIDGAPAFVFYPETDEDGNLVYAVDKYNFTVGGVSVTPETVTKDGVTRLVVSLPAYRMLDTVSYTVAGTEISGEYNLSAYLEFAKNDPALETLVLRLMKYAESAEVYRVAKA
jgi:hypothetical protein